MAGLRPRIIPVVFVVDQDEGHQVELALLLGRVGYRVRCFASAEACLVALDGGDAACIVTELALPGMSGLELTRHLRARNDRTPVVVVTGTADVAAAVDAFRSRVADFILRPFVERDLVRRLQAILTPDPATRFLAAH